jgi:elongation factor P
MASTADFRNGFTFTEEGTLFSIIEFQHVKPGKGGAFVRTKLRNVKTKQVIEKTFRAGEKVDEVRLERKTFEYLYNEGGLYTFMDVDNYDQIQVDGSLIGDNVRFMKENTSCEILFHGDIPIEAVIPTFVELEVVETEPGFKGNTAQNATKPAILSTGAEVQVPLFIEAGSIIKIDTRTGQYLERVSK